VSSTDGFEAFVLTAIGSRLRVGLSRTFTRVLNYSVASVPALLHMSEVI
jgi:hypothetical protein